MPKKSKNPAQKLTKKDKDILDKVILNYVVILHSLMEKEPSPKVAAIKYSKSINANNKILQFYSLLSIHDNPIDSPIKPKDMKQKLSGQLTNPRDKISDQIANKMAEISKSLNARSVNETVFKKLEEEGILHNYLDKENYKKYFPSSPGRKSTGTDDLGGRRSTYIVDEEIEQLKMTLKKQKAIDYLYDKMNNIEILNKILKYAMSTMLYIIISNEFNLSQVLNLGYAIAKENVTQKDIDDIPDFYNRIKDMDDKQIEIASDIIANGLIKEKQYFSLMTAFIGLFKP